MDCLWVKLCVLPYQRPARAHILPGSIGLKQVSASKPGWESNWQWGTVGVFPIEIDLPLSVTAKCKVSAGSRGSDDDRSAQTKRRYISLLICAKIHLLSHLPVSTTSERQLSFQLKLPFKSIKHNYSHTSCDKQVRKVLWTRKAPACLLTLLCLR